MIEVAAQAISGIIYEEHKTLSAAAVPAWQIVFCLSASAVYLCCLLATQPGEQWLFMALLATQVFRVWQTVGLCHVLWGVDAAHSSSLCSKTDAVTILIPTIGESLHLLQKTVWGALHQTYRFCDVIILSDAYLRGNKNWTEIEALASRMGVRCITRKSGTKGKAGNLNHGLQQVTAPFIAVLDLDQVPKPAFIETLLACFQDERTGVVQSPQYYRNSECGLVASVAWEQQRIFYSCIVNGKRRSHSVFMCGTNMIVRTAALADVGGFDESTLTEDFATSILLHAKGWDIQYVPLVLAEGLGPQDMTAYYRQQLRWAQGAVASMIKFRIWGSSGLSLGQKVEYSASASYFLAGVCEVAELSFPLFYLLGGMRPCQGVGTTVILSYLVFLLSSLSLTWRAAKGAVTWRQVCFGVSLFALHVHAVVLAFVSRRSIFAVTSKTVEKGRTLRLAVPHLFYALLAGLAFDVAYVREGWTLPVVSSCIWIGANLTCFLTFIGANFGGE